MYTLSKKGMQLTKQIYEAMRAGTQEWTQSAVAKGIAKARSSTRHGQSLYSPYRYWGIKPWSGRVSIQKDEGPERLREPSPDEGLGEHGSRGTSKAQVEIQLSASRGPKDGVSNEHSQTSDFTSSLPRRTQ